MRKFLALSFLILGLSFHSYSQTQPRAETVRTTQEKIMVNELASFNMQYLMDAFEQGIIYFSKKGPAKGNINYNVLMDAIQYYDENDKLLTVPADEPIDSVKLGGHLLVPFQKGYVEILCTGNGPLLLHRSIIYKLEKLVRGAYGSVERTSAVDQVSSLLGQGALGRDFEITNPSRQEMELLLRYQQKYYLPIGKDQQIELSSRRNVARAFPQHRSKVNSFIRKNNIDFDSAESLKHLASFLHAL